jgi:hypothetical protein
MYRNLFKFKLEHTAKINNDKFEFGTYRENNGNNNKNLFRKGSNVVHKMVKK